MFILSAVGWCAIHLSADFGLRRHSRCVYGKRHIPFGSRHIHAGCTFLGEYLFHFTHCHIVNQLRNDAPSIVLSNFTLLHRFVRLNRFKYPHVAQPASSNASRTREKLLQRNGNNKKKIRKKPNALYFARCRFALRIFIYFMIIAWISTRCGDGSGRDGGLASAVARKK